MAKAKSKTPAKETAKAAPAKAEPKFGVDDLAEATGLQPASVRVALRELSVEKNFGNKYGWDTKKDFDAIVSAMKDRSAKAKGKPAAEPKAKGKGKGKAKK